MTTSPFDPSQHDLGYLLTAYADGQLAPEGVQWVEQQLAERPELQTRLDEIRALQQTLRSGLAGLELPLVLDDGRRASVLAEAGRGPVAQRRIRFGWPLIAGLAAACLTVAVVVAERGQSGAQPEQVLEARSVSLARNDDRAVYFAAGKEEGSYRFATPSAATITVAPPLGADSDARRLLTEEHALGAGGVVAEKQGREDVVAALDAVASSERATWKEAAPAKRARLQEAGGRAGAEANAQPAEASSGLAASPKQDAQTKGRGDQPVAVPGARNAPQNGYPKAQTGIIDDQGGIAVAKPSAPPPAAAPAADGDTRRNETLAYNGKLEQRKNADDHLPTVPAVAPVIAPAPAAARAAAPARPAAQAAPTPAAGPELAQREPERLFHEELHKSLEPQDEALVYDERRAQDGKKAKDVKVPTADALRAAQQAQQAQDSTQTITPETDGPTRRVEMLKQRAEAVQATPRDEAKLRELDTNLADRNLQRAGELAEGRVNLRQMSQVQTEVRTRATTSWDGRLHDPATNRALLAERLSVLGDAGESSLRLLALAAGDADVVVEREGLPLLRSGSRMFAKDLNRSQAVVQIARRAGLQVVPVDGGVLHVDRPRGQLDPTTTFGYDRETFRALFGSAPMLATAEDARSTFALDAETASYDRARAQVAAGQPIDPAAIRPEQFINAMPMDYPRASGAEAFTLYAEAAAAPFSAPGARPADDVERAAGGVQSTAWSARTALVAIGVVARPAGADERRPLHLTLAIDCSGSMGREGGLARVQTGLAELVGHLRADDTVALVAFSDQARLVLPATPGAERARIAAAIAGLKADGATNAVDGLGLAYQVAAEGVAPGAESRVVLASDGATLAGPGDLVETVLARVRAHRERGVSLLVVGSGAGSYQAAALERLANRADGQQVFLGSDEEAKRIFGGRLLPERLGVLAKDAKVQVTWNPQRVSHARLIGYEQRRLAHTDFRNDAVDAGELSHDAQVTALYEVLLVDGATGPLGSAAVRYHDTRLRQVRELACPLPGTVLKSQASDRLRLLACAAETAEWLQLGWWSNVRLPAPERIIAELGRCPQPAARELEDLVRRAQSQNGGKP